MVEQVSLQVCAVTQGGGFAGEVVIKQGGVVKLPDHVDLVAAAGLPVIFGTAHLAIKERAQVKAGNSFPSHQWSYLLPDLWCWIQLHY
jgi:NADPH2:quinone reductase